MSTPNPGVACYGDRFVLRHWQSKGVLAMNEYDPRYEMLATLREDSPSVQRNPQQILWLSQTPSGIGRTSLRDAGWGKPVRPGDLAFFNVQSAAGSALAMPAFTATGTNSAEVGVSSMGQRLAAWDWMIGGATSLRPIQNDNFVPSPDSFEPDTIRYDETFISLYCVIARKFLSIDRTNLKRIERLKPDATQQPMWFVMSKVP